jgi:hypothetical protein
VNIGRGGHARERDDADHREVRDVFLSHSSKEKPTARRIAADIAAHADLQ